MSAICNLCGSEYLKRHYAFEKYSVMKCEACGLHFLYPVPDYEELKKIYSKEYYFSPDSNVFGYSDYKRDVNLIILTAIQRYNFVKAQIGKADNIKLLDIGCAYGYYLDIARLYGWDVTGIEIHEEAAKECVDNLKLNVKIGTIRDCDFQSESFDIITCWDLLEHLQDPQAFFEEANKILKPGGSICLTTPDISSLPAKVMGKRWMGYKSREHIYFFNKNILNKYFEKNGFTMKNCMHVGKYISKDLLFNRLKYYFGCFSFAASLMKYFIKPYFYLNPFDIIYARGQKTDS